MGRGGGGGRGGSSSHGGGSSRTHYGGGGSRGGFSGSSRSSSRSSSGRSYYGGSSRGSSSRHYGSGGSYRPSGYNSGSRRSGCGCSTIIICVIVLILIAAAFMYFSSSSDFSLSGNSPISASTVERTKLPASDCKAIDQWFEDNMDPRWVYSDRTLINGLKTFYKKTGVQPYLVLLPDIDGNYYPSESEIEDELRQIYDEIMPDGGHVVVGFVEGIPNEYGMGVYAGAQAEIVMDAQARDILMDYLDYYYPSDLGTEEYFATAFEKTAEKIMAIDEVKSVTRSKTIRTVIPFVCAALIIIVIAAAIVRSRRHKAEQAKADAEILKTDLQELSDTDPLKDKYDV